MNSKEILWNLKEILWNGKKTKPKGINKFIFIFLVTRIKIGNSKIKKLINKKSKNFEKER